MCYIFLLGVLVSLALYGHKTWTCHRLTVPGPPLDLYIVYIIMSDRIWFPNNLCNTTMYSV